MKKQQTVDYDLVRLTGSRECENPECRNRRKFGIKTVKSEKVSVFGFYIGFKSTEQVKYHCPDHRPEHKLAEKARQKEHKYAKRNYRDKKRKEQQNEFEKILESELLPKFNYKPRGRLVMENNNKFATEKMDLEEALEFVKNFDVSDPILFVENREKKYRVIENGEEVECRKVSPDSNIDYERFKSEYEDESFRTRDYFPLRTTSYTSVGYHQKPISRIENHVGEVVEWREFEESQGKLVLDYCPVCGRNGLYSSNLFYSRIVDDVSEKICVCHERCECIIGCLNHDLIDEDAYEIGLI